MTSDIHVLDDELGRLGRPAISDEMPVPRVVTVENGGFVFDFGTNIRGVRPPLDLLHRFVFAESDAALIAIAKNFGPLALFPAGDGVSWPDPHGLADVCEPHREEIAWWRRYQKQMDAVLKLFAAFREGEDTVPSIDDLALFNESVDGSFLRPQTLKLARDNAGWRRGLALRAGFFYTTKLADACRLRPALVNRKGRIDILFQDAIGNRPGGGLSLAGALTVQLMTAFANSGLALCSSCGRAFVPKTRRAAAGRRRYCPKCGLRAAWRDAQRDKRNPSNRRSSRRGTK